MNLTFSVEFLQNQTLCLFNFQCQTEKELQIWLSGWQNASWCDSPVVKK